MLRIALCITVVLVSKAIADWLVDRPMLKMIGGWDFLLRQVIVW